MKRFYGLIYRYTRATWDIGPREELVGLISSGHIQPCRAIDPGCGAGANAIYLALWGFEYPMRRWERLIPFYDIPFAAGKIGARFGPCFAIEQIAGALNWSAWPPGYAAHLMTRT